jgi:hypothetical protein
VCWVLDIVFLVVETDPVVFHMWYFAGLIGYMMFFDIRIVLEMAKGLGVPIFTLPQPKTA